MSTHPESINLNLKVWRQQNSNTTGKLEAYKLDGVSTHMSFLEMLDVLNEQLINEGKDPVVFDHDCREGICGSCNLYINGRAHGPMKGTTTCQLHMRHFEDGQTVTIEPWRAKGFPIIRDLSVDRSSFDKIIQAGGYISVNTGNAPDANALPIPKENADLAMDAAACIGCGACVAACKNASAMLFVSAKVSQLSMLPQGDVERKERVIQMVAKMDEVGFGNCTNTGACSAECPKEISMTNIAKMNQEFIRATVAA
jgi:succinate dehydrogenase / fumarate reductase, iron-sulfur subunit